MKKFLSKLPVMITFVALSVVLLGVYIYMLARPVSYGMAYKYSKKTDADNYYTTSIVVQNNKKAKLTATGKELGIDMKETMTYWIVTKGDKFAVVGVLETDIPLVPTMTEEEYNEVIKLIPDEFWNTDAATKCNAFKFTADGDTYTCTGAIVFAIVGGIIELALISFATLSVIFFIKKK